VKPLVVALAGTDHHPFRRLVEWVDAAAERRPDVRFVVQHGSSTGAPRVAEGRQFLPHDALMALLAQASVAICHGGPGTIMDAREAGHVPLCVPRDPALGEHVDRHQQRFATVVGRAGVVRHVTSVESFHEELDRALAQTSSPLSIAPATQDRDTARARLGADLDALIADGPKGRFRTAIGGR
jgi:UDP-N-acetylglucosamine transferase subunit ALG13